MKFVPVIYTPMLLQMCKYSLSCFCKCTMKRVQLVALIFAIPASDNSFKILSIQRKTIVLDAEDQKKVPFLSFTN